MNFRLQLAINFNLTVGTNKNDDKDDLSNES